MNPHKELEEAAAEYYDNRPFTYKHHSELEALAFIAGARFEQRRILELLRSDDTIQASQFRGSLYWADWIEEKLEGK